MLSGPNIGGFGEIFGPSVAVQTYSDYYFHYIITRFQPAYNQIQPAYNQIQPAYNQTQPAYNQTQPGV